MGSPRFQELLVYQLSEKLADTIWRIVRGWGIHDRNTVGLQIVRSADSIGANIAEGTGRGSYKDNKRFVRMARGSLYETQHWLRRAYCRQLLSQDEMQTLKELIDSLSPKLNAYLKSIGQGEK
ncbi:MAG: four helix bundle protein [Cyanobacteria bacterium P01_A01_bin.3]